MGLTSIAKRVIARYGQTGSIIRKGEVTGPPNDPVYGEDITYPAMMAVTNFSAEEQAGTLIAESDLKAIVSVDDLPIVPNATDKIVFDGVTYSVVNVAKIQSRGETHFYSLRVTT